MSGTAFVSSTEMGSILFLYIIPFPNYILEDWKESPVIQGKEVRRVQQIVHMIIEFIIHIHVSFLDLSDKIAKY